MIRSNLLRLAGLLLVLGVSAAAVAAEEWLQGKFSAVEPTVHFKLKDGKFQPKPKTPLGLAVSLANAHLAEGGKARVWIRAMTGNSQPAAIEAAVLDQRGQIVRSQPLPRLDQGAGEGWFGFDARGLPPGRYSLRVTGKPPLPLAAATSTFWVERVEVPERASVPIFVDDRAGCGWQSFPVTVGIPMPRSTLDSPQRVRLVDREGREVPCQVTAAAHWNPDRRDIQWLSATFLADSRKVQGNQYRLEFGRAVTRTAASASVKVVQTPNEIAIDTGVLRLVIDRRKATILKEVRLRNQPVVAGDDAGVYLQDQDRRVFCSAWYRDPPEISVEEVGPIVATLRQQGWYATRDGQRLCRYDIRLSAFAGLPYVKVLHTWVLTHDSRKVRFGDISIRFPLAQTAAEGVFGVDGPQPSGRQTLAGRDRICLVQEDSDRFAVRSWKGRSSDLLAEGRRSAGWAAAQSAKATVAVHLRHLWQQYPAELELTPNSLAVHFWPEHGFSFKFRQRPESYGVHRWPLVDGPLLDLQPRDYVEQVLMKDVEKIKGYDQLNALGMAKTHEVWLDLADANRSLGSLSEQSRRFEQPLAARADPQWIADSRALRPFAVRDERRFPMIERAIRARWDGQTYLQDRCHDYGWLHFGDRHSQSVPFGPNAKFDSVHRYWLVTDYRCGMEPWLLWARSGDPLYYRWAEIISRHLMDVDMIHWTGEDVGQPRKAGQFYPMSFAHYCSAPTSMSLHNDPVAFNLMYYYLAGYRRAMDVLRSAGERELDNDLSRSPLHRGHLITGHNQLDLYRVTWDRRYWDNAWKAINKALDTIGANQYLDWTYTNEFLQDVEDFTGDSRLKTAVLNIADHLLTHPVGSKESYPAVFILAHAYRVSGDPRYIAHGIGRLEPDMLNVNTSDVPELRGRVTSGDNVHFTRLVRQVPGFLYYQQEAEKRHGPIARRTPPILFLYDRGPVYLLEQKDRAFTVQFQVVPLDKLKPFRADVQVKGPDGRIVVRQEVTGEILARHENLLPLHVPADGQTGVYRLDINLPAGSKAFQASWSVQCPELEKLTIGLSKFDYWGGEAFFFVPKGTQTFKIRVEPRRFAALYGQPVLLGPHGEETLRLDGLKPAWVEVRPRPHETGRLWGVALHGVGTLELRGVPPLVCSDPSEFFRPLSP